MGEVHGVDSCYLYIVRNEETIRSGFGDVGVGIGESIGLECFGKSKYPVQNDGCYKVMWNGRGIRNTRWDQFVHVMYGPFLPSLAGQVPLKIIVGR